MNNARIWVDVGAYKGNSSLRQAAADPYLRVYAFEPNLSLAARLMGLYRNYHVLPMAVAESDGSVEFHINAFEGASSLLPLDRDGVARWIGGENLAEVARVTVPAIRLDTFMDLFGLDRVDLLKVDAQGADLAVVRSAGDRLPDITQVTLEVAVTPFRLYQGADTKHDVMAFFEENDFRLLSCQPQTHGQEENLTFVKRDGR